MNAMHHPILVVEDDEDIRESLLDLLQDHGYDAGEDYRDDDGNGQYTARLTRDGAKARIKEDFRILNDETH